MTKLKNYLEQIDRKECLKLFEKYDFNLITEVKPKSKNKDWMFKEKFFKLDEIPENVLLECGKLAKENSKGSNPSNVPVDYCLVKFVKKPSGSKPGKVIYTNYKTIFVK